MFVEHLQNMDLKKKIFTIDWLFPIYIQKYSII